MKQIKRLYHISFNGKLGGIISPRVPAGYDGGEGINAEPPYPRICLGEDIRGCVYAVWKNIENLFKVKNYPYIDMYVYSVRCGDRNDIVTPEVLTGLRFVHDAHITREHWILNDIRLKKTGTTIRIHQPDKYPNVTYHPFNDKSSPEIELDIPLNDIKISQL